MSKRNILFLLLTMGCVALVILALFALLPYQPSERSGSATKLLPSYAVGVWQEEAVSAPPSFLATYSKEDWDKFRVRITLRPDGTGDWHFGQITNGQVTTFKTTFWWLASDEGIVLTSRPIRHSLELFSLAEGSEKWGAIFSANRSELKLHVGSGYLPEDFVQLKRVPQPNATR